MKVTVKQLFIMFAEIIKNSLPDLDEETALKVSALYPDWSAEGVSYIAGQRVLYDGTLYKVLLDHVSQEGWRPIESPSLFAKVLITDPDIIPVWEQPDNANPYMMGDRVHYPTADDPIYESLIDNNVYSPEDYPAGWKEV